MYYAQNFRGFDSPEIHIKLAQNRKITIKSGFTGLKIWPVQIAEKFPE